MVAPDNNAADVADVRAGLGRELCFRAVVVEPHHGGEVARVEALRVLACDQRVRVRGIADDEDLPSDTLEALGLNELLSRLVSAAQDAGSMADAIKARTDALAKRKAAAERREEGIRSLILRLMQAGDVRKLQLPEATPPSGRISAAVVARTADAVPADHCRFKREPNKTAIKERLEAGADVPGVTMSNGGERLTVRT